jgi:hypothetical protein
MTNIELELMNEFSKWLLNKKYVLSHVSGLWRKNLEDKPKRMIDIELMNEFSAWISDKKYVISHVSGLWRKNLEDKPKRMSELYQMFIEETQ